LTALILAIWAQPGATQSNSSSTAFGPDNNGQAAPLPSPVNSGLSVNVSDTGQTNCLSGRSPYPFGLPCSGARTTLGVTADWWQMIAFTSSESIGITGNPGEFLAAAAEVTGPPTAPSCNGSNVFS
jgi:hypothetical protein